MKIDTHKHQGSNAGPATHSFKAKDNNTAVIQLWRLRARHMQSSSKYVISGCGIRKLGDREWVQTWLSKRWFPPAVTGKTVRKNSDIMGKCGGVKSRDC